MGNTNTKWMIFLFNLLLKLAATARRTGERRDATPVPSRSGLPS